MDSATVMETVAERLRGLPAQLAAQDGFPEVLAPLQQGGTATLDGIWGSSCALVAAALASHAPGPLVVVCPVARMIDDCATDLALFTLTCPP